MTERLFFSAQSASRREFLARELRCCEIASFGLDRSTYDHLRIAQQSQSITAANENMFQINAKPRLQLSV